MEVLTLAKFHAPAALSMNHYTCINWFGGKVGPRPDMVSQIQPVLQPVAKYFSCY
jgi:hypothetical protein